jgi:PI-3-kinase-related kinase SMG-1
MSIVGYMLGLGDRHLDNILMDFNMGDIMHIDYNVCFEKGLRLKIPEIVPFRLTQSIQGALGLTGVEGAFRQNCEDVLQTLRSNKDTILMLLEVFAWDPLMEWTKNDSGYEGQLFGEDDKKGMEMIAVGHDIQERRTQLQVSLKHLFNFFSFW